MLLIDFSSILHRLTNGSLNNVNHITTSQPHNVKINQILSDITYRELGRISHIFDEYNFTIESNYFTNSQNVKNIIPSMVNLPDVISVKPAIKTENFVYPFNSYRRSFIDNFFNGTIKELSEKFNTSNILLCLDTPTTEGYWRKDVLPTYKDNRKAEKEKSKLDFGSVLKFVNEELFPVLENNSKVNVIKYPRAEGDDVIYAITKHIGDKQKVVVITEDKDLINVVKLGKDVHVFRPMQNKYLNSNSLSYDEIERNIKKHIVMGDTSDNIQSISHLSEFQPDFIKWLNTKLNETFNIYDIEKIEALEDFDESSKEFMLINPKFQKYKFAEYMTRSLGTNVGISLIKPEKIIEAIQHRNKTYNSKIRVPSIEDIKAVQDGYNLITEDESLDIEQKITSIYFQYELPNMVYKNYSLSGETTAETFVNDFENKIKLNPLWESRYNTNRILIDMENIPQDMYTGIISNFILNDTSNPNVVKTFLECEYVSNVSEILSVVCTDYKEEIDFTSWS